MDNKEELIKQRKIGQQIMTIRIVQDESDKGLRGGISFLDRSEIAKWARISKEEMDYFVNDIAALDEFNICVDAALKYASNLPTDAYGFFLSTFRKHGYLYIKSMLGKKKSYNPYTDGIKDLASINARKIIDDGLHVDDETQSAERFGDALKFYFEFYISRILNVVSEGYDWDVVCEMIREDKEFTDLIKSLVDKIIGTEENILEEKQLDEGIRDTESRREISIEKAMEMVDEIIQERKEGNTSIILYEGL